MKILTINDAFLDDNFLLVEDALFELNKRGVYDPNFLPEVVKHLTSRQAQFNFTELNVAPQVEKFFLQ